MFGSMIQLDVYVSDGSKKKHPLSQLIPTDQLRIEARITALERMVLPLSATYNGRDVAASIASMDRWSKEMSAIRRPRKRQHAVIWCSNHFHQSCRADLHTSYIHTFINTSIHPYTTMIRMVPCCILDASNGSSRLAARLPSGATALGVGASLDGRRSQINQVEQLESWISNQFIIRYRFKLHFVSLCGVSGVVGSFLGRLKGTRPALSQWDLSTEVFWRQKTSVEVFPLLLDTLKKIRGGIFTPPQTRICR